MANLGTTLDTDQIEPGMNGFEPIPAGVYPAYIVESEVTHTKNGKGMLLKLTWEIIEGEYEHRKTFQQINYQHESAQAQAIGQGQIKAICNAIGFTGLLEDSEVLHFKPVLLRVGIEKGKAKDGGGNYDDRNDVRAVKPYGVQPPSGKPTTQASAERPAAKPVPMPTAKPAPKSATAGPTGNRPWRTGGAAA
jgi:hypothetical protein